MGDAAEKLMMLDEFLVWEPGDGLHYELYSGHPVAMPPTLEEHGVVAANLGAEIREALKKRPPCRVRAEAGVRIPHRRNSWYQPDLAVTCAPPQKGRQETPEPVLIVEVLSPSTEEPDRKVKLPDYRMLPSVQEILLVDPARVYVEVHRRLDDKRWQHDILRDIADELRLDSCEARIPLAQVYANVALELPSDEQHPAVP